MRAKENPKTIGERSEAVILAKLLMQGEVVLQPFGDNQRYDLVIDRDGRFLRIQCKTGRLKNGVVQFSTCSNAGGRKKKGYRGQADFFAVFCPQNQGVYLVPVDHVPNRSAHLRVDEMRKYGPKTAARWAKDYELD